MQYRVSAANIILCRYRKHWNGTLAHIKSYFVYATQEWAWGQGYKHDTHTHSTHTHTYSHHSVHVRIIHTAVTSALLKLHKAIISETLREQLVQRLWLCVCMSQSFTIVSSGNSYKRPSYLEVAPRANCVQKPRHFLRTLHSRTLSLTLSPSDVIRSNYTAGVNAVVAVVEQEAHVAPFKCVRLAVATNDIKRTGESAADG